MASVTKSKMISDLRGVLQKVPQFPRACAYLDGDTIYLDIPYFDTIHEEVRDKLLFALKDICTKNGYHLDRKYTYGETANSYFFEVRVVTSHNF